MLLYIHIPFCESKCKYCRFASIWNINQTLVNTYLAHLKNEIINFKKPDGINSGFLDTIYFWWWTPSILNYNQLNDIIKLVFDKFEIKNNIEITIETTPKNVTIENIANWYNLWVNRISLWIQTLNNKTLNEINRDNKEIIINWLELLKNSQIKNISLDFIIWLPYVKKWELLNDIKFIINNYDYIKHISVYMLEDYYIWNDKDSTFEKISYPWNWNKLWIQEWEFINEYLNIKDFLELKWFKKYEISNFAKESYECKHNKWYWEHKEYIWFWLWAHSFIWNKRFANKDDFLWYYWKKLEYIELLNDNDLFLEKIMFQARTNWIEKNVYDKLSKDKINDFINKWYLIINDEKLKINDKHINLIDKIILEII